MHKRNRHLVDNSSACISYLTENKGGTFYTVNYLTYLLKSYDDTYYPEKLHGSGRAAYVERNCEMINNSKCCIVYYDEPNAPTTRKNGTVLALDFAVKKGARSSYFLNRDK